MIHLAWRNIWRNKKRSILSFSSIACACIVISLLFGLITGLQVDLENNLKTYVSGDIRIRNKKFQENEKLNPIPYFVSERLALQSAIEAIDGVAAVLPRIVLPVSTFEDTRETFIIEGVDPDANEAFRTFSSLMIDGDNLPTERGDIIPAVIAEGLATKLGVGIGSRLTTLSTTVFRSTNAMTFTIVGMARPSIPPVNSTTLFVPILAAERLSMMAGGATELLIRVADGYDSNEVLHQIRQSITDDALEVQLWDEVSTTSLMIQFAQLIYMFIALIFFILGSIAIINTTIMTIFERSFEIGLLGSLGMQKQQIRRLFFLESVLIAVLGAGIGVSIGTLLVFIMGQTGIDAGTQMEGVSLEINTLLYPQARTSVSIGIFLYSLIVSSVATLIPTRKILKLQPVETLRERSS